MDSLEVRRMVTESAVVAAELIARPETEQRWAEDSALEGMTVGALAAHLVRAIGATLAYLDRTDPTAEPEGELLTKATYFHAAIDSPIHERIKEVSANEAAIGPAEMATKAAAVASLLAERLPAEPVDRLVGALGNRMLTLDDFCRTRMIEIGMHIDDLAQSIGVETPALSPAVTGEVIDILVGIARHVHGDWAVIHALGRAERSDSAVFPVL